MCNKLYELAKLFQDNIWSNIIDVPQVLDYTHKISNTEREYVFKNFMLYKSEILNTNCVLQLEYHKIKEQIYFIVKFYKTKSDNLEILNNSYASQHIDKTLSLKIYEGAVNVMYSENYFADDILRICKEPYNYIHDYMCGVRGLSEEQLKEESKKLSEI